ncbi:MAG: ATP-binding cassette domain-containing protein [Oscillospiraceae bacterium]|nr:ATP-binding cassette domain-containing protein [Oscillospiraceae bacterium]
MIEVKNLSKAYGSHLAVNNISFEVNDGEILGFLGPNGAGKSTTMNILTGYISSTGGEALINGIDILKDPIKAKKQIGYLPEIPPLYLDMTVKEYLYFMFDLKKCSLPKISHIKDICSLVKINDVFDRIIKNLSKGYKQRVGLAQALIGNPPVLILDEPTVGLDPKQIIEIRNLIKRLGKNHTVILSSHILSEVQAVCDRVIIINKGVIAADDTAFNLSQSVSNDHRLVAAIDGPKEEVIKVISAIPGVETVNVGMQQEKGVFEYEIEAAYGKDIRKELNKRISARNWCFYSLRSNALTLEDIFLKITMGENVAISNAANSTKTDDSDKDGDLAANVNSAESNGADEPSLDASDIILDGEV